MTQKLFTRKQTAAMLAMSVGRLVEQEQAGKIVGLLDGRVVMYTVEEIDRFVAELPSHEPT